MVKSAVGMILGSPPFVEFVDVDWPLRPCDNSCCCKALRKPLFHSSGTPSGHLIKKLLIPSLLVTGLSSRIRSTLIHRRFWRRMLIYFPRVTVTIKGGPSAVEVKILPKHKKNPDVGEKKTVYSSTILVDQEDAKSFEDQEEVSSCLCLYPVSCSLLRLPSWTGAMPSSDLNLLTPLVS